VTRLGYRIGPVPNSLRDPVYRGPLIEATPDEALLRIPGLVSIRVLAGTDLVVQPADASRDEADWGCLLDGPASALAHLLEGRICLRGAAVSVAGTAVVIVGDAGKSMLAAALIAKAAAEPVADGVVPLAPATLTVLPTGPEVALENDSALALGLAPAGSRALRPGVTRRVHRFAVRPQSAVPAERLCVIHVDGGLAGTGVGVELNPLAGTVAFQWALDAVWHRDVAAALGRTPDVFTAVAGLAALPAVRFRRERSSPVGSIEAVVVAFTDWLRG